MSEQIEADSQPQRRSKRLATRNGDEPVEVVAEEERPSVEPQRVEERDDLVYVKLMLASMAVTAIILLRVGNVFHEDLYDGAPLTVNNAASAVLTMFVSGLLVAVWKGVPAAS